MSWFHRLSEADRKSIDETYLKKSDFKDIMGKVLTTIINETGNAPTKGVSSTDAPNAPTPAKAQAEPPKLSWEDCVSKFYEAMKTSLKAQGGRFTDEAAALKKVKELMPPVDAMPILAKFTSEEINAICNVMDMMQTAVLPLVTKA
ncbi:MAG: hypothetical protein IKN15_01530 [Bacteroidaceae bacterium]|nr:hypothetical protein [Bacteroidaceae bacterium]